MSEKDNFLSKKESNSSEKDKISSTQTKLQRNNFSFSTNYLPIKEQLVLILKKNITVFIRNTKSLIAIFLSPIIFLLILVSLQYLSDNYSQGNKIKEHEIENIHKISLKCEFPIDCLSLGITYIVYFDDNLGKSYS